MICLRRGELAVVFLLCAPACKENCYTGPRIDRCEGDVHVSCPGGWLRRAPFYPDRDDCTSRKQRCVASKLNGGWVGCIAPLGSCDAKTFIPRCNPYSATDSSGTLTRCVNGEILASGDNCEVSSNGSR